MNFSKNVAFKIPNNIGVSDQISEKNAKLLILVAKNDFGDAEMETLQKMISAIKMDFTQDVNLLILQNEEIYSLSTLNLSYQAVLAFGVEPRNIGYFINTQHFKILEFYELKVMFCPSIREIKSKQESTKLLWNQLQTMFLIKTTK
ncbi:MAG: hypothetical protein R2774_06500 [Saprospiraceae bacterium]